MLADTSSAASIPEELKSAKMVKFVLSSILPLLVFCAGQAEDKIYADILNQGYEILKVTEDKELVFNRVEALQRELFSDYPSYLINPLKSDNVLTLLNIPNSSLTECATYDKIDDHQIADTNCSPEVIKHVQIILDAQKTVHKLDKHIKRIEQLFQRVFKTDATEPSEPFEITDDLYHFIENICSKASTCFFHQIVGKQFLGRQTRRVRSSAAVRGEVYYAYLTIIFHLLKGYAADMYRQHNRSSKIELASIRGLSQAKFLMHTHVLGQIAIPAIKDAPPYIVREELSDHSLGSPYMELRWYVSRILVNEAHLNPNGTCKDKCDYGDQISQYPSSPVLADHDVCHGRISTCFFQPEGNLHLTSSDTRRYEGITLKDGRSFGNVNGPNSSNVTNTDVAYYVKSKSHTWCSVCTCLCDDHGNPHTVRTFSLKEVTSNIEENMVITGMKLVQINGIIYIRIREGKLRDLGRVTNIQWTRINTFKKATALPSDFFEFRSDNQSSLHLDTISLHDDFVQHHLLQNDIHRIFFPNAPYLLTGVKFINQNGVLRFAIRLNVWNESKKRISYRGRKNWIVNENVGNRESIDLRDSDVPTKTTNFVEFMDKDYAVTFRHTSDLKDFGQTTVPFLDTRAVITRPPMPLSGAGLFYKGKRGYGGIIGLKLVAIDFSDLITTELLLD